MYLWADDEASERYVTGEILSAIKADGTLKNIESRVFGAFQDLSSVTVPHLTAA